ncbi:hypothetical protein [Actinoplanes palleronii]|uniref:Uncharacterized protein n=1 Tax=Actinoplanes palleronii TaxID=113570 RepID=A0ABQ4BJH1_9ACTN|nr:hypothetical protein [Actinoplanes palleronii]GIE70770.1 hypothetical protein Apa02nite_068780 [Actinoplanes palleronii]
MSACPTTALGRTECAQLLIDQMARIGGETGEGCEITVSTAPPLVTSPYGANGYECPHGTTYWIEPTSEQIMRWNQAGVR